MELFATLCVVSFVYLVTVNAANRRKIKRLKVDLKQAKDDLYQAQQLLEMNLLYGKAEKKTFKEKGSS